jgi:hypothetical protein
VTTTPVAPEVSDVIEPGVLPNLPGGLPPGFPPNAAKALTNRATAAQPKSPEEKQLQELLKLKFDRSASSILDALADQMSDKPSTNAVERFKQNVIVGKWEEVGTFLKGLTNDYGKQVYRYLLKELASNARTPNQPNLPDQPPIPQVQPAGGRGANSPTLVSDDILALAAEAPHPLESEDTRLLGQLLTRLLTRGDALEPFLAKLETGVKGLGGKDLADRRRAADLLIAANRLVEAGPFLTPVETSQEKADWAALELSAKQLVAEGKKEKDSKLLEKAWGINQFILAATNAPATNREAALRRSFELMPQISRETGTNWLRRNFSESPRQGLIILSAVSQTVQQGMNERALDQRQKNLELQKQVVENFLEAADPSQPHWHAALNLLAQGWLQEGSYSRQRFQPRRTYGPQYDDFGNMIGYEQPPMNYEGGNQFQAIPVDQVVSSAPSDKWLAQLDESLRLATFSVIADLYLKAEVPDKALPYIETYAKQQPRGAADLANDFLRGWTKARNPVQPRNYNSPYASIIYSMNPYAMRNSGAIPLTRAMQQRNIRELTGLMRRLDALHLPALNEDAMVGAFSSAHSPAEVFRLEDMESVFGSLDKVKVETLAGLAQTMRERLAQQWRQPRVQQDAKTQRNDKQIESEMMRGYELVAKLIQTGLKRDAENWQLNLAQAAAAFDLAEYQYGKKVDLSVYVEKREEAFKGFERAARLYSNALPKMEEKDYTPKVFQQWFNASLGASDLAYVTRQQEPDTNQLQRIQSAIYALPGPAAEKHMGTFAKALGPSANMLKSELKPRYLRAGLRITGERAEAEDARKLATYYNDLLQELQFIVAVDGDATVGHTRPFGLFVTLRHTADVERESGGFGRYLRNNKRSTAMYYSPYMQQQRNFTEEFDKLVREKLGDKFDVKSVTYLDDKVQSRGYGRLGWRETPLAYVLLQAKDASADQIPTLNMDLDFMDSRGQVVLPVESQPILVDARPASVPARPINELEITQVLDDREMGEGRLTLEIKATGKGLVAELPELVKTNFTGLRIEEVTDRGTVINQVDAEGDQVLPMSERNWMFKFRVADDAPASLSFHFPEVVADGAKTVFKRYVDADLVEVDRKYALAGLNIRPRPWWHWAILAVAVIGAGAGLTWWLKRHKPVAAQKKALYALPEPTTPFTVIGLLRQMQADASLRWTEAEKMELAESLKTLESHFFARERNGHPAPDLAGIGRRWVELAGNGHSK